MSNSLAPRFARRHPRHKATLRQPPLPIVRLLDPPPQLKRGMKMEEVTGLLGPGKQLSESVGDGGLKTQVYEYLTDDRRAEVTYVDGLVVRFSVSSK
jgi:hypothetical protein